MNLRDLLKKELSTARPARYRMDDRTWVDDVADRVDLDTVDIDLDNAVKAYIRNVARDVEGRATQAGNRLLRDFHKHAALPMDWPSMVLEPIALENVVVVDGAVRKVQERVRLRDATARDFELWAETEDRARQRDYDARGEAVAGAVEIAMSMRSAGVLTFGVWAESVAPVEKSAA